MRSCEDRVVSCACRSALQAAARGVDKRLLHDAIAAHFPPIGPRCVLPFGKHDAPLAIRDKRHSAGCLRFQPDAAQSVFLDFAPLCELGLQHSASVRTHASRRHCQASGVLVGIGRLQGQLSTADSRKR